MKRVSVNARQTPLRDILLVLCRDAGLNLIIEKDVDPNVPVTLVLSNVTLKDALDAVFFPQLITFIKLKETCLL